MNQPKAHILKQRAELVYPYLALPEEVREFRPFYEGVLSFHHTKGDRLKVYHGYRKDGFHVKDWNLGWEAAKQYTERKQTFKFLARTEIEAPDLTDRYMKSSLTTKLDIMHRPFIGYFLYTMLAVWCGF